MVLGYFDLLDELPYLDLNHSTVDFRRNLQIKQFRRIHCRHVLLRLVERGVRFVNVSWDNFSKRFQVSNAAWDTHENNFPMLKNTLLPNFDQTYAALMEDLDARGLLDETLVVTMGEMGRTPKINAKGGRDHWTYC